MTIIENLQFILPELMLLGAGVGVLMGAVLNIRIRLLWLLALAGTFFGMMVLSSTTANGELFFSGMLIQDNLSMFFRAICLLIAGIVISLSLDNTALEEEEQGEFYFFILIATLSMMLAVSSNNLLMIYLSLEAVSLISYVLAGYLNNNLFSSEAGIKYFLFGTLSTGITLYGISLIYGLFGHLDLTLITQAIVSGGVNEQALLVSSLLVLTGLAFKCSLVPFHMWTPDVYQGAPTPVAAFFSVGPKAIGFALIIRIFIQHLEPGISSWWPLLAGLMAVLTMTLGNISALKQDNIKRLLAYSTIAQAGYILAGLAVGSALGVKAVLFYIVAYAVMNLGAFGCVIALSDQIESDDIEDYAGLYKRAPVIAVILAVSLLSLAGMPPLAGFMAKFLILTAAIGSGFWILAVFIAVNTVIALFYYLKVLRVVFLHEPKEKGRIHPRPVLTSVLALIMIMVILLGLWPRL